MAIFKRGKNYWFEFVYKGERYRKSTKQRNYRAAEEMESAFQTALAKGDVGITDRVKAPTLEQFQERFMDEIRVRRADKPATVEFYSFKFAALKQYGPLAKAKIDKIDEALIADFVQWKSKSAKPATVNRCLAVLRRALRLAQEWKLIQRVPRIRLLSGEHTRDFVLTPKAQELYLAACPEPLRSVAELSLETGARIGEILALRWSDVHLNPVGDASRGFIQIRSGKSKNAKRNISLTSVARNALFRKKVDAASEWVFPAPDGKGPLSRSTVSHQHTRVRRNLQMPADFVVHSCRHTMLTRLGGAGVDVFTIMRIAGHCSVVVSERYVHPTPETLERAFDQLEAATRKTVPTNFTTAPNEAEVVIQ